LIYGIVLAGAEFNSPGKVDGWEKTEGGGDQLLTGLDKSIGATPDIFEFQPGAQDVQKGCASSAPDSTKPAVVETVSRGYTGAATEVYGVIGGILLSGVSMIGTIGGMWPVWVQSGAGCSCNQLPKTGFSGSSNSTSSAIKGTA
jgi:hypothetical protein